MTIVTNAAVNAAVRESSGLMGVRLAFLPLLVATMAYFRYDMMDPEKKPADTLRVFDEYDFIVVGAGSAGAIVASRLSETPNWSVLLLEAGGKENEMTEVPMLTSFIQDGPIDWKYQAEPSSEYCRGLVGSRCRLPRGKVLGGTSSMNGMLYARGNRFDFEDWEKMGNPGWNYENALYYYKKSEDQRNPYLANNTYHSEGGYQTIQDSPFHTPLGPAFIQAGQEIGYDNRDLNGETPLGFMFGQYTLRRGARCSTAKSFLSPARLRNNLHISTFSQVTRVLINPDTKRAYAVEFVKNGKKKVVRTRKEVIISGGAINSPQLLMLSGVGPREHLQQMGIPVIHDLPGVGQNLTDHYTLGGFMFTVDKPVGLNMAVLQSPVTMFKYASQESGPLSLPYGIEAAALIKVPSGNPNPERPDIHIMLFSGSQATDLGFALRKAQGVSDELFDGSVKPLIYNNTFNLMPYILYPKSRGNIRLKSKNPLQHPAIHMNYFSDPYDMKIIIEGIKFSIALTKTQALRRFGAKLSPYPFTACKHKPYTSDAYWECALREYTQTMYHYSGTCKMGPSHEPWAVVDPRLRVYGIDGLRVADASIIPLITGGNTNAPAMMIGEKVSDLIKEDWSPHQRLKGVGR